MPKKKKFKPKQQSQEVIYDGYTISVVADRTRPGKMRRVAGYSVSSESGWTFPHDDLFFPSVEAAKEYIDAEGGPRWCPDCEERCPDENNYKEFLSEEDKTAGSWERTTTHAT
ncbi:MAG: hypothetical protein AB7I45_01485 [Planctomycetota bacterium]